MKGAFIWYYNGLEGGCLSEQVCVGGIPVFSNQIEFYLWLGWTLRSSGWKMGSQTILKFKWLNLNYFVRQVTLPCPLQVSSSPPQSINLLLPFLTLYATNNTIDGQTKQPTTVFSFVCILLKTHEENTGNGIFRESQIRLTSSVWRAFAPLPIFLCLLDLQNLTLPPPPPPSHLRMNIAWSKLVLVTLGTEWLKMGSTPLF